MVSNIKDLDREVLAEMSMVDIVYSLLKDGPKEPRSFQSLLDEAFQLKGLSEEEKIEVRARLYTDINIDGRFKGVGDNVWGLRSWYPVEQAEEIVITDIKKKSKRKKSVVDDEFDDEFDDEDLLLVEEDDLDDLDDLEDELDDEEADLDLVDEIDDVDEFDDELDDDFVDDDVDDDLVDDLEEKDLPTS